MGWNMYLRGHPHVRDLLELLLSYGLILAVIWTPMPWQRYLYWLAVLCIVLVTLLQRERLHALGLAPDHALYSFWIVAAAILLAMPAVVIAWRMDTLHSLPTFGHLSLGTRMSGYVVWSFLQEFVLQVYVLTRLLHLFSRRWIAISTAALLFAVVHMPNPVLAGLTLLWALIACPWFLRYRNLYALGLAHGILGICVAITVPDAVHHHMRVGLGYLHYHPHQHGIHRSSAPQIVSTPACVMEDAATLRSALHARP